MKNKFIKVISFFIAVAVAGGTFGFGAGAGSEFMRVYLP